MTINKINIEVTLKEVGRLFDTELNLPSAVSKILKVLVLLITALVERVNQHKKDNNKLTELYRKSVLEKKKLIISNAKLKAENKKLKQELKKTKIKEINKAVNKPSSKQAEWEPKGVGNDNKGKPKRRGNKGRKGAGNKPKHKKITKTVQVTIENCPKCGKDLKKQRPLNSTYNRKIEDITDIAEPEVIEAKHDKKYCPDCKEVITAKSELALPKSDIGLNLTVLISYLWVTTGLPFPRIAKYLLDFFNVKISTAGLSSHVIRVSKIMNDVYDEILQDVKNGSTLYADETGWRIKGVNWWLWVFGTEDAAYYVIDPKRGGGVVLRILGEIFIGVLVVDGWSAYTRIICDQQSCMAHLLRKIRKFYKAYPELKDIARLYIKLRRIIKDGERLQEMRSKIEEEVFYRRYERLKTRLEELMQWPNPSEILTDVIKKVKKQQPRILTFVEHPGVPCHNNFGEYLIRIGVLKRKISGGSKSEKGAKAYAVLLSVYTTCKLRKISFSKFLKESLKHYIRTGKPLLLKEYSASIALDKAA